MTRFFWRTAMVASAFYVGAALWQAAHTSPLGFVVLMNIFAILLLIANCDYRPNGQPPGDPSPETPSSCHMDEFVSGQR